MKRFLMAVMVVGAVFAAYGCGEKSNEEKAKEAAAEAKDTAEDAKDDAAKKLGEIGK